MSEFLIERLKQFTPDGNSLDRDALLFAAGRASARPNRSWMAAVAALAACQILTLGALWPNTPTPADRLGPVVRRPTGVEAAPAPPNALELGLLAKRLFETGDGELPAYVGVSDLVPSDPPLRNGADLVLTKLE